MTLNRKDAAATTLTALAVAVFAATHEGWHVWLVGDSHRWAAAVIAVVGIAACALGTPGRSLLGVIAGALAVVAIASGSLTPLSLLVAAIVLLWAVTTWRHAHRAPRRALPT